MKKLALAGLVLAAALGTALTARADEVGWSTSYKDALARAKKEGKVVLADFTGSDWCGWCMKLKSEVFDTKDFQEWASKNVVLLELDFPKKKELPAELKKQNQELAAKFKIRGYPTILFINADGEAVGQSGYLPGGPGEWTKKADPFVAKGRKAPEKGAVKKDDKKKDDAKEAPKADKKDDAKAGDASWGESYDKAIERAKKEKKLVLADFTGSDWCGWCIKLKNEVFETKEFKEWAAKNVVLLELDFPRKKPQADEIKAQNQKLSEKFGIQGFPTILFLDGDGNKVGEMGYMEGGPSAWTGEAQKLVDSKK